jgi:hypothetical protein
MRALLLCLALCVASPAQANSSNDTGATDGASSATDAKSSVKAEALPVDGGLTEANSKANAGLNHSNRASAAALTKAELCRTAASEATANNLPADFFTNLIQQESGFRPNVVSPAGAQGIAQFMPPVASSYGLANPFEPVAALKASARLLSDLVEQFGNLGLAAAAYNAGPKRVQDWMNKRRKLPAETRHYVHKITGRPAEHWANLRTNGSEGSLPSGPCDDLPIIASNPIRSASARNIVGAAPERETRSVDTAQDQSGAKHRAIVRSLKPRFAGNSLAAPAARSYQRQASVRTQFKDKIMSRLIATPTPIIMAEEKTPSRRHVTDEKRRYRSLPRPSEFIVGARVPAAIKASEAAALARNKTSARWAKEMSKNQNRVADADPSSRGPSSRAQRKS